MNSFSKQVFGAATALVLTASGAMAHGIISNSVNLPAMGHGATQAVSVSCHSGHVSGGGYELNSSSGVQGPFTVLRSYPSSRTTWTVEVMNHSANVTQSKPGFGMTVYATCAGAHRRGN